MNDCGCRGHDGPHWLHMADLDRASTRRLLEEGNVLGFIVEEAARCKALAFEMRANGCTELPDDRESEHWRAVVRHLHRIAGSDTAPTSVRVQAFEALKSIAEMAGQWP